MSKVMRTIDAKSFIIGVLSAVVVCMAMGAAKLAVKGRVYVYTCSPIPGLLDDNGRPAECSLPNLGGIPFAVSDGKVYYYK